MPEKPAVLICLLLLSGVAFSEESGQSATLPDPCALLDDVRNNLPQTPLLLQGRLRSGPLRGGFDRTFQVEIRLKLGATPLQMDYRLCDRFGETLERMLILRYNAADVEQHYTHGAAATPAPAPQPSAFIQGTDITWGDLTLSFLWLPAAKLIGRESLRGRDCFILELVPMAPRTETYRLWVDEKMPVFLQMEALHENRPWRRLMVRSFKKTGNQWMVKDVEVRNLAAGHRTILQIDQVVDLAATNAPATTDE